LEMQQEEVNAFYKDLQKNKVVKICVTLGVCILTYFLADYTVIKLVNFLFYSNSSADVLKTHINNFVPENFNVSDALTNEVLFPTWNINQKIPVFFSKMTQKTYGDTNQMYDVSMNDMVWASAANPNFFTSAKLNWEGQDSDGNLFFGGNTVADCPALFAQYISSNFNKIPAEKIRMVAVGNKQYSSDKITDKVSVLDWVNRLYQLTGPVKKFTQNYMAEHILRKNNRGWHYFFLPSSNEFSFWKMFSNAKDQKTI
jgi:hypothetical protein